MLFNIPDINTKMYCKLRYNKKIAERVFVSVVKCHLRDVDSEDPVVKTGGVPPYRSLDHHTDHIDHKYRIPVVFVCLAGIMLFLSFRSSGSYMAK